MKNIISKFDKRLYVKNIMYNLFYLLIKKYNLNYNNLYYIIY